MTEWNRDISSAPRVGKIWLAVQNFQVVGPSYWVESRQAWAGLGSKEEPIAWYPYFKPEHPDAKPVEEPAVRKRVRA
jgi:hypothetical protein